MNGVFRQTSAINGPCLYCLDSIICTTESLRDSGHQTPFSPIRLVSSWSRERLQVGNAIAYFTESLFQVRGLDISLWEFLPLHSNVSSFCLIITLIADSTSSLHPPTIPSFFLSLYSVSHHERKEYILYLLTCRKQSADETLGQAEVRAECGDVGVMPSFLVNKHTLQYVAPPCRCESCPSLRPNRCLRYNFPASKVKGRVVYCHLCSPARSPLHFFATFHSRINTNPEEICKTPCLLNALTCSVALQRQDADGFESHFTPLQTDAVVTKHAAMRAERRDRNSRSKHPNMSWNSLQSSLESVLSQRTTFLCVCQF